MCERDLLAQTQADAGAFELFTAMEPLEHLEDPLVMIRIDADAGVGDADEAALAIRQG